MKTIDKNSGNYQELTRQMESLHQQIEQAMLSSPLSAEEKMAVLMRFNLTIMHATRGSFVEMEISDGSKISLRLQPPKALTH